MRIQEIAEKISLKENAYIRSYLAEWIKESSNYADIMIQKYGFNKVQSTKKGYQVLFLMNKICPNLHHFKNRPNFTPWDKDSWEEYRKMSSEYMLENTQVGLVDENGVLLQDGVHYTDEEYDAFIEIAERILKEESHG